MAYGVKIAAVPQDALDDYRAGSDESIPATRVAMVSHYGLSPHHDHPAEQRRFRAVDGGAPVREGLRHPLREPLFHKSDEVAEIAHDLAALLASDHDLDEWTLSELTRLSDVYSHAAERGEAVVTMLEPPHDEERASRTDLVPLTNG